MNNSTLPDALFRPLTSNRELIDALQAASREPREIVIERLLKEHRCIGTNVRDDAAAVNLTPYVWSDDLIEFYRTTKAFLYESAVWNRAPLKREFRDWIGQFLVKKQLADSKVLLYGDGLGIDSAYVAQLGCQVTYYEPSEECVRFANIVFEQNDVQVTHVTQTESLEAGSFDLVICLDVLEHVPDPPEVIQRFAELLRVEGMLITHSPFFYIEPYHPTHLKSNVRYSGDLSMFIKNGLQPYDGKFFWDPIVLKKTDSPPVDRNLRAVNAGKWLLKLGRLNSTVHSAIARMMSKGEKKWIQDLEKLQHDEQIAAS